MINQYSTSRKDDLECLMYMICFLYTGKLPISEYMHRKLEQIAIPDFLDEMLKYRVENHQKHFR